MSGIRKKLFFQIGGLVILLVSIMIISNTLFLEQFYIIKQKNILLGIYDNINEMNFENYEDNIDKLINIEAKTRVDLLIKTSKDELLYTSNNYIDHFIPFGQDQIKNEITNDKIDKNKSNETIVKPPNPPLNVEVLETISESKLFLIAKDSKFNVNNLVFSGILDNKNKIEIRLPIASIKSNISLINDFLIIIGAIIFFISLIVAFMISVNFTMPIREMNDATKKLKNLDFTAKCKIYSNDEIGQLGESINELSLELSDSINTLSSKNEELNHEIYEKNILAKKRRDLLNNVSHELKTPLALIQGYAEGLKVNIALSPEKSAFYTDVILNESKKMNLLVETMLNTSQIDSGDLKLELTSFEINDAIDGVINNLFEIIKNNNVDLKFNRLKLTNVIADKLLIERVITNYLTNAIYHSNSPKKVEISLLDKISKVRINIFNRADFISEEEFDFIWDGFYKVDKARTRENSGHGLGLSIVSTIMNAHNYDYGAYQTNDGVVFWFELGV